jgi:hypothetical protein
MAWFRAMWFVVTQKFGANAIGLQRALNVCHSTAWNNLHKLRRAMIHSGRVSPSGTVEVDEAYIGGLLEGSPGRAAVKNKSLVVLAVELKGAAIGRVRMKRMPSSSGENILGFIKGRVKPGSTALTNGWRALLRSQK